MDTQHWPVYEFGPFRFDVKGGYLLRHGALVPLSPKVSTLLGALLEGCGRVVTKSELMDILWPDAFVQEASLHVCACELRRSLGQVPGQPQYVETIPRRGYRFAVSVTVVEVPVEDRFVVGQSPVPRVGLFAHNLRRPRTTFIERHAEIAAVMERLDAGRCVTLTGPGGMGKTRLALEVALRSIGLYSDGVWLIELASVADPLLVARCAADALGQAVGANASTATALERHLGARQVLLVFDSCEHVIEASAGLVASLLGGCPNVRVLATSRQPLGVRGEAALVVPPLSFPDSTKSIDPAEASKFESLNLFRDRARRADNGFDLDELSTPIVAEICRRLDGIPLAIELAAARACVLALDEILEKLDDRFRLLTTRDLMVPPRQRTLWAMIDWSYALLTGKERFVFERLSVFAGGCSLMAAEAVCLGDDVGRSDVLDLIAELVDKSLVTADTQRPNARYSMLESIREFAAVRLREHGDEGEVVRRHCEWYATRAEQAFAQSDGPHRDEWNRRLEADHDNLRAGLRRAIDRRDTEAAMRLSVALYRFWATAGFLAEGRQWIEATLAIAGDAEAPKRATALFGLSRLALIQADHHRAVGAADECLSIRVEIGDRAGEAAALGIKALAVGRLGHYDKAYALGERSLAINRELALDSEANESRFYLGLLAMYRGDFDIASNHFDDCLAVYRAADNQHKVGVLLHNVGELAWFRHDCERARDALEECLRLAERLGLRRLVADTHRSLARTVGDLGHADRAHELFRESLRLQREIGNLEGIIEVVEGSACVAASCGDSWRALVLATAATTARGELTIPPDSGFQRELNGRVAKAMARLSAEEVDAARARGRVMTLDEAAAFAIEVSWGE